MNLFAAVLSRGGTATVLGALALSACTVVVEEPRPIPQPGPRLCTREYQPVCARRGPERRSFPNACEADRAGFRIEHPGQCRGGGEPGSWTPRPPRPPRPQPKPGFCTREYAPVCATRRGALRTFSNACEARAADFRIVDRNGPC